MSERGSFVTQYIYCDKCLEAAIKVLISSKKELASTLIPNWSKLEGGNLPIIAGKIGGSYAGEELIDFETNYIQELEKSICHPLRIAVICDSADERIFNVFPNGDRNG